MKDESGFVVPPLSRADIRAIAARIREAFKITEAWFPIVEVLDILLPTLDPAFYMEIVENEELGDCHALTIPEEKLIKVRCDVYERAASGHGRDRGTLAHEFGHLVLHARIGLARRPFHAGIEAFRDSEWQAKAFAGELLVCPAFVSMGDTVEVVAERFGVSEDAARIQLKALRQVGYWLRDQHESIE